MASTIAASTAGGGGIIQTADSSGNLNLQSGTTTILALTSTGVAITGTLSATGGIASASLPAGTVLQVVSATKTDTSSFTSSTFADIGSLTVTITPRNTSSKFLVMSSVNGAWQNAAAKIAMRLMRDATPIAIGDTAGSRPRVTGFMYAAVQSDAPFTMSISNLDSPATASAITYKCQASNMDASGTVYVNKSGTDTDSAIYARTASSITVFEIAG
jgi:hypothetical protein